MSPYMPYPQIPVYNGPAMDQLAQLRQQQYQPPQQFYQPSQPAQIQQQQSGMVWVRNRLEAENYPVAPNTAIALWDMSGPYVHRKETDVSGRPVVKTFQLVEAAEAPRQENSQNGEYVTRAEFQALAEAVASMTYQPKFAKKEETANE